MKTRRQVFEWGLAIILVVFSCVVQCAVSVPTPLPVPVPVPVPVPAPLPSPVSIPTDIPAVPLPVPPSIVQPPVFAPPPAPFVPAPMQFEMPGAPTPFAPPPAPFVPAAQAPFVPAPMQFGMPAAPQSASFGEVKIGDQNPSFFPAQMQSPAVGPVGATSTENKSVTVVQRLESDPEMLTMTHDIDTLKVETSGNWVVKRKIWEDTEEVYEEIKKVITKIFANYIDFLTAHNTLDREIDIFEEATGMDQGVLQDITTQITDLINKDKKQPGFLNQKEYALVRKFEGKKRDIDQLNLDVKSVNELSNKIGEALEMNFQQLDKCDRYEEKAWENFKEIAIELDDKKARKLYYETETILKNINAIDDYISKDFTNYFHETARLIRDHMKKISDQLKALGSEGIDLQKEFFALTRQEIHDTTAQNSVETPAETKENKKNEKEKKVVQEKAEEPTGFFVTIVTFAGRVWGVITSTVETIFEYSIGWFTTSSTQEKETKVSTNTKNNTPNSTPKNAPAEATKKTPAKLDNNTQDGMRDAHESFQF